MYVRKKHNRSGSTSVVVVSKTSGKYKEIKSFGSSTSEEEIDSLCEKAKTITTIRVRLPENGTFFTKTLFLTEKHLAVKSLFDLSDSES